MPKAMMERRVVRNDRDRMSSISVVDEARFVENVSITQRGRVDGVPGTGCGFGFARRCPRRARRPNSSTS